jgi:hypothetical protein
MDVALRSLLACRVTRLLAKKALAASRGRSPVSQIAAAVATDTLNLGNAPAVTAESAQAIVGLRFTSQLKGGLTPGGRPHMNRGPAVEFFLSTGTFAHGNFGKSPFALQNFRKKFSEIGSLQSCYSHPMGGWVVFRLQWLVGRAILAVAAIGGALALLYAAIVLVRQAYTWLKGGYWPPAPISERLWDSFRLQLVTEWVGVNKILAAIGDVHIAVPMIAIAIACFAVAGVGARIADDAEGGLKRLLAK